MTTSTNVSSVLLLQTVVPSALEGNITGIENDKDLRHQTHFHHFDNMPYYEIVAALDGALSIIVRTLGEMGYRAGVADCGTPTVQRIGPCIAII